MLKTILFLILFAIFDQECAAFNSSFKQIALGDCYSLFNPNTEKTWKYNGKHNSSVFQIILDDLKGFDFFRLPVNGYYTSSDIEGIIQYNNGEVEYVKLFSGKDTVGHVACGVCVKGMNCDICPSIKSKLRNGIFYLGNKRSLMQNEGGDIVYDASMDEHPKKLTLFQKFEKIPLCLIRDDYIVLVKRGLSKGPNIVYNQATNTKHVESNFYPLLQDYYYEKYPWKNPDLELKNDNDIKINQAGDLVIKQSTFSYWISACHKKIFNKVIMPSHSKLLYLQSSDDVHAYYAFNVSEKKFYCISRVPEYNEYDINEWFYADTPSLQPLKQSLIGYYFGAYLVALKAWFDRCKSYFLHKDEII